MNKDALNFIRSVLKERTEQPSSTHEKDQIIKKIKDIDEENEISDGDDQNKTGKND